MKVLELHLEVKGGVVKMSKSAEEGKELQALKEQLKEYENRLRWIDDWLARKILSPEAYDELKREYQLKVDTLKKQISQ